MSDEENPSVAQLIYDRIAVGYLTDQSPSDVAQNVLDAITASDFVIVPKEPTLKMMAAMQEWDTNLAANNYWSMYRAAIGQPTEATP